MDSTTIGLDLAKTVFHVHGVDESDATVIRKTLRRSQVLPFFARLSPCLVGMEACGTSHHWARELIKLGHDVRLMPPAYVKPYVKRGKTDANDAEAICEAVTRPKTSGRIDGGSLTQGPITEADICATARTALGLLRALSTGMKRRLACLLSWLSGNSAVSA